MEMNFCRRCGTSLTLTQGHVYTCQNGHTIFKNASPASCLWIVDDKNGVLVAERAINPGKGKLDAPGGFNDGAETFEAGIARELEEEIGLSPASYTTPQFLLSQLDPYDYQGENVDVLGVVFWAQLVGNPVITPKDDVAKAYFTAIDNINPDDIYFDAVREGFLRLKEMLKTAE